MSRRRFKAEQIVNKLREANEAISPWIANYLP